PPDQAQGRFASMANRSKRAPEQRLRTRRPRGGVAKVRSSGLTTRSLYGTRMYVHAVACRGSSKGPRSSNGPRSSKGARSSNQTRRRFIKNAERLIAQSV